MLTTQDVDHFGLNKLFKGSTHISLSAFYLGEERCTMIDEM